MLSAALILSTFNFFHIITVIQAEVSLVFTDLDVYFNPEYIAPDYEVFLLDEGIDNQVFINFTLIKKLPMASTAYFKMLGATMGEYKINTGFEFQCGVCDLIEEPIIFGRMVKKMGMGRCPGEPGVYGNEAFELDLSTLPDEFVPNKYILDLWLDTDDGEERIGSIRLYFTVQ